MDNNFTPADYAAMNGGFGGGNQEWLWIILFFLFAGGGNGFGGNRKDCATTEDVQNQINQASAGHRRTCGHGAEYYRQYAASGSVTITPTAAGTVTVYLALNGVTLPCSVRQQTVVAASPITINTSAIAFGAGACACNTSTLTLVVSGAAGTVDYVTAGAVRLA